MNGLWSKLLAAALLATALAPAQADQFPAKPIKFIVGSGAGGGADLLARLLAENVSNTIKQPVVVENRRGVIAASELKAQPANGYTIGFVQSSTLTFDPLVTKATFKPDDVEILLAVVKRSTGILASKDAPFHGWDEFVAYAKDKGTVSVAASTLTQRLAIQKILKAIGSRGKVIAAGGGAEARVALLGHHVDIAVVGSAGFAETKAGGPFQLIAVTDTQRNPDYADFPTVQEKGIDVAIDDHFALIAPRNTPKQAATILADAFANAFEDPQIKNYVDNVIAGSPFVAKMEEGKAVILDEYRRFKILTAD